MDLNQMCIGYVDAFMGKTALQGGLMFADSIDPSRLDGTLESLKYIDEILLGVFESGLLLEEILEHQSGQNLVYGMAFYAGYVVGNENDQPVKWINYQEFKKIDPRTAEMLGDNFSTSLIYMTKKGIYFPLSAIMTIIAEGPEEKSVWYSSMGAITKTK